MCARREEAWEVAGEADDQGWEGVFLRIARGHSPGASSPCPGNLPAGLFLQDWPVGNEGGASVPAPMKGVMKHGFLQLAALTSQGCRSLSTH